MYRSYLQSFICFFPSFCPKLILQCKVRQLSAAFLLPSEGEHFLQLLNCSQNSGEWSPRFTRRLQVNTLLRKWRSRGWSDKDNCFCLEVKRLPLRGDHIGITGNDVVITRWVIYLRSPETAITIHYCRAIKMMTLFFPYFLGLPRAYREQNRKAIILNSS